MRITTAGGAALLTVAAVAGAGQSTYNELDRFRLFNDCNQIHARAIVKNDFTDESYGVTEHRIRDLVESRLRAARLYAASDEPSNDLPDNPAPALLTVWVDFVGTGYVIEASFRKWVRDRAGLWNRAPTWGIMLSSV